MSTQQFANSHVMTDESFLSALKDAGVRRIALIWNHEQGKLEAFPAIMQPLADWMQMEADFIKHEAIFLEVGQTSGVLLGAFIWWTHRGQGCGGIRMKSYDNVGSYLIDGLRLASGMGRKNAIAGIWWGGAKGVVMSPTQPFTDENRARIFHDYGRFLTSLRGCYVAAEDSGVTVKDVDEVFKFTRHITCISPSLGGSGNPSVITARGVMEGIKAALAFLGKDSLEGATIAVQGCGQVGWPLCKFLKQRGAIVKGAESSEARISTIAEEASSLGIEIIKTKFNDNSVLAEDVDVVSPCAWGGILNKDVIPTIKAKIVCGAANNQLKDVEDAERLHQAGVLYVPDYVVNRMGVVNCSTEVFGNMDNDPMLEQHFDASNPDSIPGSITRILKDSKDRNVSTEAAAVEIADVKASQDNPITGWRGQAIIRCLRDSNWATN